MNILWDEFYARAAVLGHDASALTNGEEITTYGLFKTLPEGRRLLSMATAPQRTERQKEFFNPPVAARYRLGQGKHDRGEAILFADGAFEDGDHQGVDNHMPARLKAVSVASRHLAAGEVWDVSVRGAQWGIDDMEELYVTLNIGELVLEPGARLIIRGNVFSLVCQRLVCIDRAVAGNYHIGILPTPFSVDLKNGPIDGRHGANGLHGQNGLAGEKPPVGSSILGYNLVNEISKSAMSGTEGTDGSHGQHGVDGRNGGMCKIAEITIRDLQGLCTVFAQAGQGGQGGDGGHGGPGGQGGVGAEGYRLIAGVLPAGDGAPGGIGGNGGKGGNGGHGGLASNIYIWVPSGQEWQVECLSLASSGGGGGRGGQAGHAGLGGRGGDGPVPGMAGNDGNPGITGKNGLDGRSRPAPWMWVNEVKRSLFQVFR